MTVVEAMRFAKAYAGSQLILADSPDVDVEPRDRERLEDACRMLGNRLLSQAHFDAPFSTPEAIISAILAGKSGRS